ncbi:hypothetical protein ACH5RR_031855 [Cinchona calisaya]|uniref:Small subunit processome component 20 homolog n=1 Tax=Cinchona calisaya TaxID=153742 RepID=A0ABD2YGE9_9GENT
MATTAEARHVKSLNTGAGSRRFVYKSSAQQIAEIEIDVYRSLDAVKAEPSEGSTFFRDCLIEWRELNTAEDFISFYQETLPLVQTLPQIILQKEMILSKLLCRLQMKSRLSLEPILRLIAALSRDLLEDFVPFLKRIVNALIFLLKGGADREPEIIKEIFTSWSYIMMFLQKYLIKDVVHVLKVTLKMRYYPHGDIQKFMAESLSFLMRNAPVEQLIKGIRKIMIEVVKKPLAERKYGATELLWHVIRGTSSTLHSRAPQVLRLLLDECLFSIGNKILEGSDCVLEVVVSTFQRLSNELGPMELSLMWDCLYGEIIESISNGHSGHLGRLLSLLACLVQNGYMKKITDFQLMFELVRLLVQTYVTPGTKEAGKQETEVINKILQLGLFILDGLHKAKDKSALSDFSCVWIPVFSLRNTSLVIFLKDLVLRDSDVLKVFKINIISALNDLIDVSEEETLYLLLRLCENLQTPNSRFLDGISKEKLSRIYDFVQRTISYWTGLIKNALNGDLSSLQFEEKRLPLLWGTVKCYPYLFNSQENLSLLLDFLNALDELLMIESGFVKVTWQSLFGTALSSYKELLSGNGIGYEESAISKFLYLAKKYCSSSQILSPIADILDSLCGPVIQAGTSCRRYHPELEAGKVVHALDTFSENLCHFDQSLRQSALRILCHYEPLKFDSSSKGRLQEKRVGNDAPQTCNVEDPGDNVLELLLSVEAAGLSSISRKNELLISRIQMIVSATRIDENYVPALLYGMIGIFHLQLSSLWDPAMECLAVLINQHFGIVWDRYIQYLDCCQSMFLISCDQSGRSGTESLINPSDLVGYFNSSVCLPAGPLPCATVLSLLIRSLQKVPSLAESRSRQLIPLFLKFLGYRVDDLSSVELYNAECCKGKEWKEALREWLKLFSFMRNPKSFYQSQLFKDVLLYRLLDETDAELQLKVLDCLLNWKDELLLPYSQHLKDLINAKNLREELTTWSLSRESNQIDEQHRNYIVPIVIRILVPKVRKLKALASRKHASVHQRRAILGFLAELDVKELPLFFALLIKPLLTTLEGADATNKCLWSSPDSIKDHLGSFSILKQFTVDGIKALSWKKRFGFLHVIEEVLAVFDESRINPFLDLLMGCVVRVLESCTVALDSTKCKLPLADSSFDTGAAEDDIDRKTDIMTSTAVKQFKELRSLCLKIISSVLGKFENHDFSSEFWDRFFSAARPLIAGFKQEGASSEKPSSLFSCFLAMSRCFKFMPLLCREKNLVPDIFSMFTITTASDAIISCVFKFVENLITLDTEVGTEDSSVKSVLIPHLNVLVDSLHSLFTHDNRTKRYSADNELALFKLLSQYIKEPLAAKKFVDILLPFLAKRSRNSDSCADILQIIQHVVEVVGSENSYKILSSVSPLLTFAGLVVRKSICDVLNALAKSDSSVLVVAKLLSELNATSAKEMGSLDYDTIIGAYEKINRDFFYTARKEHALIILSHSVYDMSSEELILRQSAYRLLLCFVEFASEILEGKDKSDQCCWNEALIQHNIRNFLLKHMGNAITRETSVQKLWIDLLREMVLKLPRVANLGSYGTLYSQDPEQDFFNNIIHLQKHRRARALSRFTLAMSSGNLCEVITTQVFVPMFFNLLLHLEDGKAENVRSACMEAIASISGCMSWKDYYNIVMKCFREMTKKREKQKILLRLICSILDHFHFSETCVSHETYDSAEDFSVAESLGRLSSAGWRRGTRSTEFSDIQTCIQKIMLPKIQKLLTSDSDNVNVTISLVSLKLLKLLPGEIMDLQLPSIVHRISNFLNHRLVSVRDEARSALAACLKELGLEYLQFIVKVLRGTLKSGRQLHILGYTLNFVLSKFLMDPICGKLDYCLEDLLSVIENDILGDVSEQKEVDKFAAKMKETRKQKSFETLKLVAQSITFRTHAVKLLSLVTVHLQKQLTPKLKSKLENMLDHIAAGIGLNPSVNQTELFIFVYRLIKDGTGDENQERQITQISKAGKRDGDAVDIQMTDSDRLINVDPRYSHLITSFALGLLQNHIKGMKLDREDEQQLSMLDPFVGLLGDCLCSKYENIVSTALRCLSPLVKLPLPSLESQADKIKNSLLVIAQGSVNAGSPLMESCLRLLTVLLRSTGVTLSADQLHMLIQFPLFVDIERNPSFVCLSLLKAIVKRKLVVPEIYDVVKRVAELMVTCQMEPIRKQCSQILLQFLLDYRLSGKRLQQHLDFLLLNLRYEHSSGREAVLEMLHAIIMKFPASILEEQSQTMFVHLVVSLANDHDSKIRSMTGAAIKLLIGHVSSHSRHSILEYSLSWYVGEKQHLWSAAAQVLGLLVEVMKQGFQKHVSNVLPVMRRILRSGVNYLISSQLDVSGEAAVPMWKEAYYSLVLLEKILNQFQKLSFEKDFEEMWEMICEFLLHPHLWLRNISNRLVAFYFSHVTEAYRETLFLMRPSRLFLVAASLCCQLKTQPTDDAASNLIAHNLVFTICHMHTLLVQIEYMDFPKLWSNLDDNEQGCFLKAFHVLDSGKGRSTLEYLTSDIGGPRGEQKNDHHQHFLVSYLLKKMGKISLQIDTIQMKVVFNCFKSISPTLVGWYKNTTPVSEDDVQNYAYLMLLPLYRVCEGYAGSVISDDMKQLAQEVCDSIRDNMGVQNFVQFYSRIRKNLKAKRDKRKQEEKLMAVVNPMRNAKRKLRIASKHRANKKRKIMTMKMGRWLR